MTDRLRECPFCGGDAEVIEGYICWAIECGCGISTIFYDTKEELIEYWNTRKPMDRIVEQIEGMFGVDPMYYGEEVKWAVDKAIEIVKEGGKNDLRRIKNSNM